MTTQSFFNHSGRLLSALAVIAMSACGGGEPASDAPSAEPEDDPMAFLVARGDSLELDTEYVPPPGEALHHHTSGFAKVLCSAVFITGLDAEDAAANVGGFTSPFEERVHVVDTVVDYEAQRVSLTLPDGVTRTAKRYKNQGCVTSPIGEDSVYFTPTEVARNLPPAETTPWPMGDVLSDEPWPAELDMARVEEALDTGFGPPEARTLALVVTYKGRIIGERYAEGIGIHTPLESWSMGKSLTGALMGVLIQQGAYDLWQPAPIPEWQGEGDPRQAIRIGDIMRMSSGIRIRAPQDPDFDPSLGYPDHLYLYTGTVNSFEYAATRPQEWEPNTVGRYRNTDPVLTNYLIRLAVEGRGEDYHSFPQRALFDRIGIRDAIMETDPYGNFLTQGYEFLPARDWARLGNLYLQDGVWMGERVLPEGYVEYATTLAPAWLADGRPTYGGAFMWVNGSGDWTPPNLPYSMRGAGGQSATMIPSHGLVVVRLGKYTGSREGGRALNQALDLLLEAVPPLNGAGS
jgi:CubicO group peptidase (beta-lactamase class C family)